MHKASRAIAASIVLAGIAFAWLAQVGSGGDPSAIALTPLQSTAEDTDTSAADPAPTAAGSVPETVVDEPFTYRVGVLSGVTTDNHWAFYGSQPSVWNAYVLGPTKPALYTLSDVDGSLQPELASAHVSPSLNVDGWEVRVGLNQDLAWSDGTPITARDIVFTFKTVRELGLGGSWSDAFPDAIASIEAASVYDLRIEFKERPNLSVWPFGVGLAPIMPAHFWEPLTKGSTEGELYSLSGQGDPGGGPLALSSMGDGLITSVANPGYPFGSTPDVVEYRIYPNEDEAVAAIDAGEIDVVLSPKGLTEDELALVESNPDVTTTWSLTSGLRYLGFNMEREPMSEQAFRAAVALLLDREALAEEIGASVVNSFVSSTNTQLYDPRAADLIAARYAGDRASRFSTALNGLREVGYTWETEPKLSEDGTVTPGTGLRVRGSTPRPLTILTPGEQYEPGRPVYAAAVADTLGSLGFDARVVETDFDTVVDLTFSRGDDGLFHYDMYLLGWTLGNPALPGYYRPLFAADGVLNNTGYDSTEFSAELANYEGAFSLVSARDALWEMETILAEDLPYLLLYTVQIAEVYRSDRVAFGIEASLGGLQGRLGGIGDVTPAG